MLLAVLALSGLLLSPGSDVPKGYPPGSDVKILTDKGDAVGPLDRLRVHGKFTVFDVYADWCGPCRIVERRLREIVKERGDIAVRKLNVVHFTSPLGKQLGPSFDSLPYLIVFSPKGERTEIVGADLDALDEALQTQQ
jgi:thiol-disulfide isomerase/thioredoxin